ncbi:hypothetical protein POTOM_034805 [Populus tomentosa]|uniref:Protein kinase domain-containing protein n=1 Tax=Populus tomentosa TaxID=118781 RepID=A0A8X7Z5H0_POPTO|nr:hypothetical protein POTOM_034805 [Populus tomentosa]
MKILCKHTDTQELQGKGWIDIFLMMVSHFKPFSHSCTESFIVQVADFGLTKLTKAESASLLTRLVGTFGYMSPE